MELNEILKSIADGAPEKIVFSKPSKNAGYRKLCITRQGNAYMSEGFTDKQAFHKKIEGAGLVAALTEAGSCYKQINAWSQGTEHIILVSKKGHVSYKKKGCAAPAAVNTGHDRKKRYIIEEGSDVPPLVDMGIFTKDGKVVRTMYDKFRQINRFLELINDEIKSRDFKRINIIDFGCGKSYLTFVVYYYLTEIMHIDAHITGLDLKEDVIAECSAAAERYGYSELSFEVGDINGYKCSERPDMVISLHACDTATDHALYNAVSWGAELIFSVPCCQHELNAQMEGGRLSILTRYGIVKERTAALMTDAIRGNLLQYAGYRTQLLEFVDLSHTPKNILIRAVKANVSGRTRERVLNEAEALMDEFGFDPALYRLFRENGIVKK